MTVQELHIDWNQKLDKVHTNRHQNYLEHEIDWWLNEAQTRFLKRRSSPKINQKQEGNQFTQKRYDDLQTLIRTVEIPAAIIDSNSSSINLPHDYYMLKNDRSLVQWNCNSIDKSNTITKSTYIATLHFPVDLRGDRANNYFQDLYINITNGTGTYNVFDINDYPVFNNGITSPEEFYMILPYIIDAITSTYEGIEIYINNYGDINYDIILVMTDTTIPPINIQWGWHGYAPNVTEDFDTITYECYDIDTSIPVLECENRVVKTEDLYHILKHDFATTKYDSPVSNIANNKLIVHSNDTFIVNSVKIDYYKVPRRINYYANVTSEIHHSRHSEIVDIAVQLVSAHISASNYQGIVTENSINE